MWRHKPVTGRRTGPEPRCRTCVTLPHLEEPEGAQLMKWSSSININKGTWGNKVIHFTNESLFTVLASYCTRASQLSCAGVKPLAPMSTEAGLYLVDVLAEYP